jgi:hypothetical protein
VFKGLHLGNLRLRKVNLLLVESLVRPHAVSHHVGGEEGAKNWFLIFCQAVLPVAEVPLKGSLLRLELF